MCPLNSAVEELNTLGIRLVEAQVYYTKKKCFLRTISLLHIKHSVVGIFVFIISIIVTNHTF